MKVKVKNNHNLLLTMESVSMTDIVMNMFIFFFITFSLFYTFNPNRESKIDINLPDAQSGEGESNKPLILNITKEGYYFINKKRIPHNRLKAELTAYISSQRNRALIIRADEKADYGLVIDALDKAKMIGIENLALATIKKKKSG
ncbi:MAG: ExbD/TolR family protein [Nitrospirota bacterium]